MDDQATKARTNIDEREAEILAELLRLLRTDAEIMETVRDMVRVSAQEAARRPAVLLQSAQIGTHDEDLLGGQGISSSIFGQLLGLVKDEKDFIRQLITKILRL